MPIVRSRSKAWKEEKRGKFFGAGYGRLFGKWEREGERAAEGRVSSISVCFLLVGCSREKVSTLKSDCDDAKYFGTLKLGFSHQTSEQYSYF